MAELIKVWEFASSTSSRVYQTLKYDTGEVTCNCPGWTRRVGANGNRSCRHTRAVDLGTADAQCSACKDYGEKKKKAAVQQMTSLSSGRKFDL